MIGLKQLRVLNELSLQQVADAIGVTKQTISKWEKRTTIPEARVEQLMKLFNVDNKQMLIGEIDENNRMAVNEIKNIEEVIEEIEYKDYCKKLSIEGIRLFEKEEMEKEFEALIELEDGNFIINVWAISKKEAYRRIKKSKYHEYLRSEDDIFEVSIRIHI